MRIMHFSAVWRANRHGWTKRHRASRLICLAIFAAVLIAPVAARAEGLKAVCPAATETTVQCMSFEISGVVSFEGSGEKGGFSPADLRSAYKLPSSGGSGQTVAIVDAYNDPNAESDLKTYRSHYGLSECTTANGCFKKVNQNGEAGSYPESEPGWSTEMSLDLDMVSAVCPECHILLVEATSATFGDMDAAENEAATLKATEISDSWGALEHTGETSEDKYFDHPGIPITVSAGDYCYINECEKKEIPNWPATSPDVISVGGTKLEKASNSRGWSESVWYEPKSAYGPIGTGSGCSLYESKPSWETGSSCSKRTDGDVAAVAACASPLSIYDSYAREGWFVECGTSAAAPIVAGVEGLSTNEARKDGPELFGKLGSKGKLFDVTEGFNYYNLEYSSCGSYLCEAKTGYDGPTGNGTPDGAFLTPENTALPVASPGTPDQAVPESTTTGTWTNEPTGYTYQWERCNATGGECKEISGAAGSKYTPVEADVEHTLVVTVTAKNEAGSSSVSSAATNSVQPIGRITEYSLPAKANVLDITTGPDGNLWFTSATPSGKIGKITPSGTITEYALPAGSYPIGIVTGPDGNLWFTNEGTSKVGKITPSGTITEYALPSGSDPRLIAAGPDGNLWFAERNTNKVGKITPSGTITEYALPSGSEPRGITAGPDGNLWFTDKGTSKVGKITTSGTITEYALPESSKPWIIVTGPDGNLWFTDEATSKVGKITTSGTVTEYALPSGSYPNAIAAGADGNVWFGDDGTGKIGRITPSGTITEYSVPSEGRPYTITAGPDDNLWFGNNSAGKIGKITP